MEMPRIKKTEEKLETVRKTAKNEQDEYFQPEVNIGLVGHC